MRRLILAFLVFATVLMPQPASADHEYVHGRWDRAPLVGYDGKNVANLQDGAYYWQDRGFDGYVPPLPAWNGGGAGCATPYDGWIVACTISRGILQGYCSKACDGMTYVALRSDRTIYGAYVLIADDLLQARRQQVWRHEFGHAIGMGHTSGTNCVMYESAPVLGETCWHDYDTITRIMYPGRRF